MRRRRAVVERTHANEGRVVAIDEDGIEIGEPSDFDLLQRDREGHFAGCRWYGCGTTRCRDSVDGAQLGDFAWIKL